MSHRTLARVARATALGAAVASLVAAARPLAAQQPPAATSEMDRMMSGWSESSKKAATMMAAKYGAPAEMTPTMAVWGKAGPWKRTVVSSVAVPHRFPAAHDDVMEQVIDYRVPPAMVDELARYDGSVVVERTKGELSARCDLEGANLLALNLAHEIATGRRTVDAARRTYAEQIAAMKAGRPAPYTERLTFAPPAGGTADPDRPAAPPVASGSR